MKAGTCGAAGRVHRQIGDDVVLGTIRVLGGSHLEHPSVVVRRDQLSDVRTAAARAAGSTGVMPASSTTTNSNDEKDSILGAPIPCCADYNAISCFVIALGSSR